MSDAGGGYTDVEGVFYPSPSVYGVGYGGPACWSNAGTPPAEVVERFLAEGDNGTVTVQFEDPVPGRFHTAYRPDGTEGLEPDIDRRALTVFRRGDHGVGFFATSRLGVCRHWLTLNPQPMHVEPWTVESFEFTGHVPDKYILPFTQLHPVLREFVTTVRRPDSVRWAEQPVEIHTDGGVVTGWTLAGKTYGDKPAT